MGTQTVRKQVVEQRVHLRLFGAMSLANGEVEVALPKSRKVRALLAYLALTPREVTRSHLCELLWDGPSDPRGELRWCLSRMRSVLEASRGMRIATRGDALSLALEGCQIDALDVSRAMDEGLERIELDRLRELGQSFRGELLEGLHIDDSPAFNQWLMSERRRLRTTQAAVLAALVKRLPADADETLGHLELWLKIDPFERIAHERLLESLVRRGRLREAEEHLAATIRMFELEGLEWLPIREAWRAARQRERPTEIQIQANVIAANAASVEPAVARRASICVLPFLDRQGDRSVRGSIGDGLADDIITRLAKLRVLFVIARGTAFSLVDRNVDAEEAGRILGVDYVASGSVRRLNGRIRVTIELIETQRHLIVWSDELECADDATLMGLDSIGNGIVASIAEEIETSERNRSILKPPSSLDAWEAYHRGLWHIYRFNGVDNDHAERFFRQSTQLDPTFARAHSGLSFAHFQNAFLLRPTERTEQIALAYEAAGRSLMADDRDPSAHWAMGRALWLQGDESGSLSELSACVDLSPNFAMGHYTLGFVHSQSGDPRRAIEAVDHSRSLSPFDPLLFAMMGTQALAHARLGNYDEAANWALKAAARPNAHAHIIAIAANCLGLAGRVEEGRAYLARIKSTLPGYSVEDFFHSFRFTKDAEALLRSGAKRVGLA